MSLHRTNRPCSVGVLPDCRIKAYNFQLVEGRINEQHNMSGSIHCMDDCIPAMVLGREYGVGRHMAVRGNGWIGRIPGKKEKGIIPVYQEELHIITETDV